MLLAPTRQGLQEMLKTCEDFAASHSMLFSTDPLPSKSKTKCMLFSRDKSADQVLNVRLNGDNLPWVSTAKHLGNHLSSKLNFSPTSPETKTDLLCKRAILFDKIHQVQQQFGYYEPKLVLQLLSIYSTAMYGSPLWQLNSEEHAKLTRSWNTAVKMIWDLPHPTHTRFLESLCPVPHLKAVLFSRYVGFINNLKNSSRVVLKILFNTCVSNLNTVTGQNIGFLLSKFKKLSLDELILDKSKIKNSRVYSLPQEEAWKISLIEEISLFKKNLLDINFDEEELEAILEIICTD
jgi:hypothetical protein